MTENRNFTVFRIGLGDVSIRPRSAARIGGHGGLSLKRRKMSTHISKTVRVPADRFRPGVGEARYCSLLPSDPSFDPCHTPREIVHHSGWVVLFALRHLLCREGPGGTFVSRFQMADVDPSAPRTPVNAEGILVRKPACMAHGRQVIGMAELAPALRPPAKMRTQDLLLSTGTAGQLLTD